MTEAPLPPIVVDTREQAPLEFAVPTKRAGLKSGDYSLEGSEESFAIERKGLADLFQTCVIDRPRFVRELERLSTYKFACILVEGSLQDVLEFDSPESVGLTPAQRAARPSIVLHSLLSWWMKYGVAPVFASKDRAICARVVLRLAQKFMEQRAERAGAA